MTAPELKTLLSKMLANAAGGSQIRWQQIIGEVKIYPLSTHPHCNWDVRPSGGAHDIGAVEKAVDVVRNQHPYIDKG